MENKRLFLGMEVIAPWPEDLPFGRILLPSDRHLTLAFLGDTHLPTLQTLLQSFPPPPFPIGLAGFFDHPIFLPPSSPRAAAWHVHWLEMEELFLQFQEATVRWLKTNGLSPKEGKGKFLSHVTIARRPFVIHEWKKAFVKLPLYLRNVHLCESLGKSHYEVCWTYPILSPFEEKEHTADLAFVIRANTLQSLHLHAQLALSFYHPGLLDHFTFEPVDSLEELIRSLNRMLSIADEKTGTPFKAVSYHGEIKEVGHLEWEMIVDV